MKKLDRAASVADLRRLAESRLPRAVFDLIDGAAADERALGDDVGDFDAIRHRPPRLRPVAATIRRRCLWSTRRSEARTGRAERRDIRARRAVERFAARDRH